MKNLLTVLFTLQLLVAKAQTEFLATVNPTTGAHSIVCSIPNVNWIIQGVTTFDKNNHRYIFQGKDFSGVKHLYSVDAITNAVVYQPLFSKNAGELHYDNSSNTLYGLYIDSGQMFVASIDISSALITNIATLPVVGMMDGTTFFDEANHRFVVQSSGFYFSTNVLNGNITTTSAPTSFYEQQFDNSTGNLYGLVNTSPIQVAKINASTGTYTVVCTVPTNGYTSSLNCFDETNHRYVFGSNSHLFSIDVNTNSITSNPTFPVGISSPQNVIELHFDNSNGTLYALHWGSITTNVNSENIIENTDFTIFPNPVRGYLNLTFTNVKDCKALSIYSSLGQLLYYKNITSGKLIFDCTGFSKGLYFIKMMNQRGDEKVAKFVVEP